MKRSRFTEEQIIGVLKEAEAGAKTAELVRKHGISVIPGTVYSIFAGVSNCGHFDSGQLILETAAQGLGIAIMHDDHFTCSHDARLARGYDIEVDSPPLQLLVRHQHA